VNGSDIAAGIIGILVGGGLADVLETAVGNSFSASIIATNQCLWRKAKTGYVPVEPLHCPLAASQACLRNGYPPRPTLTLTKGP
jgi:hypothetical protein